MLKTYLKSTNLGNFGQIRSARSENTVRMFLFLLFNFMWIHLIEWQLRPLRQHTISTGNARKCTQSLPVSTWGAREGEVGSICSFSLASGTRLTINLRPAEWTTCADGLGGMPKKGRRVRHGLDMLWHVLLQVFRLKKRCLQKCIYRFPLRRSEGPCCSINLVSDLFYFKAFSFVFFFFFTLHGGRYCRILLLRVTCHLQIDKRACIKQWQLVC